MVAICNTLSRLTVFLLLVPGTSVPADPLRALREHLYERGVETCDQGKWKEALPIHERLTQLDPDYGFGWMGLGWSLQYSGDFDKAIPAYRRALELGGMPPSRIHRQIAECLAKIGKAEECLAELEQAVNTGLTHLEVLKNFKVFATIRRDPKLGPRFRALIGDIDVAGMTREQGWAADVDFLARELLRLHYNPLRTMTHAEFDQAVDGIKASVVSKSDEQLTVEVMRFLRRIGDGHTWGQTKDQAGDTERALPILIGDFQDGIFVTGSDQAHSDLLWARIDEIEGLSPKEILAKLDSIVSCDNPMRLLAQGPWYLRFPGVLKGLGVSPSSSDVRLRITDRDGKSRGLTLAPDKPITTPVRRPPGSIQALPIHIKRRVELYWFERLPETSVVYFQYNGCQNADKKPLDKFSDELFDSIENSDADTLIIDLRWNGGGNLMVSRPLLARLLQCRKVLKPGHLFVIAGRHTFSAAMVLAAQVERYTPAIFVGEPTGSSPNFVGETNLITLPYSKMVVSISNLAWQNSLAFDRRPWIAPRIRAPMSFAMWRQGRDEAVEAIVRFKQEK